MTADIHALSGAYVLDALEEQERIRFERHVEDCAACALEVAELRETAARLADDVWSVPPPRLRGNVLAAITNVRQERPVNSRAPRKRRQTWRHRTLIALATASFIGVAAIGGVYVVTEQRQAQERARIEAVRTAPDRSVHKGQVSGGGTIDVVLSPAKDAAVITLDRAPATPKDRAYQLWLIRDGKPISAGVLPAGKGDAIHYVTGVRGAQTVAVTVEPKNGSPAPTSAIVGQVGL